MTKRYKCTALAGSVV